MSRLALLRTTDEVHVVHYQTVDGWHQFIDHNGDPRICEANPAIAPYPLPALLDLLPLDRLDRRTRKRLLDALGDQESGARFFEAGRGGGIVELPLGNVANGWRSIVHEATDLAVTEDERGSPIVNLQAVQAMRDDLGRVGVAQSICDRLIRSLVNVVRSGHNAHFLNPGFKRHILGGAGMAAGLLMVSFGFGVFVGTDLLGSNPVIAEWWYRYDAGSFLLPVTMGIGAYLYLRRPGAVE